MKIGIFGGTFDPIHLGHLMVAEEARVSLQLDQVIFIPAGQPWFKSGQQVADVKHRLAMVGHLHAVRAGAARAGEHQ